MTLYLMTSGEIYEWILQSNDVIGTFYEWMRKFVRYYKNKYIHKRKPICSIFIFKNDMQEKRNYIASQVTSMDGNSGSSAVPRQSLGTA